MSYINSSIIIIILILHVAAIIILLLVVVTVLCPILRSTWRDFHSSAGSTIPTIGHGGETLEPAVASSNGRRAMIYEPPRQDLKRPPCRHNLAFKLDPRRAGLTLTPHNHPSTGCRRRVTTCLVGILPPWPNTPLPPHPTSQHRAGPLGSQPLGMCPSVCHRARLTGQSHRQDQGIHQQTLHVGLSHFVLTTLVCVTCRGGAN